MFGGNAQYLVQGVTASYHGGLILFRTRGTRDTPTDVQVGDLLGELDMRGYLTGAIRNGARLRSEVTAVNGSNLSIAHKLFLWDNGSANEVYNMNADGSVRFLFYGDGNQTGTTTQLLSQTQMAIY